MAKRRAYSIPQKIAQLAAAGLTQRRIAERIGVSTSTLRRWREGGAPSEEKAKSLKRLTQEATGARQSIRRRLERQGIKPPAKAPVTASGRRLQRRRETPEGVRYEPGKIVEYQTEGFRASEVFDLVWPHREQALARARRQRREPGSFRFVMRERGKRAPIKAGAARGGPRHSAYVTRLMREKENVQHRKPKSEREKVGAIYMTRPIGWTAVLHDDELRQIIAEAQAGRLGGGGWPAEIVAVRFYPSGL